MKNLTNQQIINQFKSTSLYVQNSKECGDASNLIYQTLTAAEQEQMQQYMRQSCKMEDGNINIFDCPLTRRMFDGFYTTK